VYCWLVLTGMEAARGGKVIDTRLDAAAVTFRLALDCCVPDLAVTMTAPELEPTAMPEALMLATLESDETHSAELVMSLVLESE
jgi:hypothetical protein